MYLLLWQINNYLVNILAEIAEVVSIKNSEDSELIKLEPWDEFASEIIKTMSQCIVDVAQLN